MWNIQNGEEKKYPAVENCILAFCGVLCYTVNRCRAHKQGIARKITECSRPSTRKTKLKEKTNEQKVLYLVHGAVIAALYVVLTMLANALGLANYPIQVRFSEALTILPVFTPAAIPGLFLGCIISNTMTGCMLLDIIFGSLATLIGAFGTYLLRDKNKWLAPLPPIIANTIIVPFVLAYVYHLEGGIPYFMLTVGIGEVISCGILGMLLRTVLQKYRKYIFDVQK